MNRLRKKLKDSIESFNNLLQQICRSIGRPYNAGTSPSPAKIPTTKPLTFLFPQVTFCFRHFSNFLLRFLGDFIGNFQRDLCVVWLGFLLLFLFFFFFGFLLVLKEIFIGGVVDAGDQIMGFTMAKVPLQIKFWDGELREERGKGNKKKVTAFIIIIFFKFKDKIVFLDEICRF